jgi:ketosteroid isomerase-like protein
MLIRSDRSLRFLLRRVRAVVVTGVVVFGSSGVVHAQASAPVRSDQDILIQLEHDWDAAFHRHDAAFIDRILADEFIVTYDNGVRADRTLELELAKSLNENIESSTMDEFIVKEFGNTAVVWFTLHLVGPVNGERVQNDYRFTDVFVLRDGRWQCVSSQSTRVDRNSRVGP